MLVPFNSLPAQSKVWVYQSERPITDSEVNIISSTLEAFTQQWMVHGQPLNASFDIRYRQFIILAAHDTASGCSIDSSVRVMKTLGERLSIDFFRRNLIAFLKDEQVFTLELGTLKKSAAAAEFNESTMVFNNAVSTLAELENTWIAPAGSTWLKRYFASEKAV